MRKKMHWLAQGLRKVQEEPGVIMETQSFKRNLFLNLYREGEKNVTLVCFFLPLKRERKKKMSDTCSLFPILETPGLPDCYPLTSPGDLPNPGIEPGSPTL